MTPPSRASRQQILVPCVTEAMTLHEMDMRWAQFQGLTVTVREKMRDKVVEKAIESVRQIYSANNQEKAIRSVQVLSDAAMATSTDGEKKVVDNLRRQIFEVGFPTAIHKVLGKIYPQGARSLGVISFKQCKDKKAERRVAAALHAAKVIEEVIVTPLKNAAENSYFKHLPLPSFLGILWGLSSVKECETVKWWTKLDNVQRIFTRAHELYPGYIHEDGRRKIAIGLQIFQFATSDVYGFAEFPGSMFLAVSVLERIESIVATQIQNGCDDSECRIKWDTNATATKHIALIRKLDPVTADRLDMHRCSALSTSKRLFEMESLVPKNKKRKAADRSVGMYTFFDKEDQEWYTAASTVESVYAVAPLWRCFIDILKRIRRDSAIRDALNTLRAVDGESELTEDDDIFIESARYFWTAVRFSMLLHNNAEAICRKLDLSSLAKLFTDRIDKSGNLSSKRKVQRERDEESASTS